MGWFAEEGTAAASLAVSDWAVMVESDGFGAAAACGAGLGLPAPPVPVEVSCQAGSGLSCGNPTQDYLYRLNETKCRDDSRKHCLQLLSRADVAPSGPDRFAIACQKARLNNVSSEDQLSNGSKSTWGASLLSRCTTWPLASISFTKKSLYLQQPGPLRRSSVTQCTSTRQAGATCGRASTLSTRRSVTVLITYRCFSMPVNPGSSFAHARIPTLSSLELMQIPPTVNRCCHNFRQHECRCIATGLLASLLHREALA